MTKFLIQILKYSQHWFQATFVLGDFINALLFLIQVHNFLQGRKMKKGKINQKKKKKMQNLVEFISNI